MNGKVGENCPVSVRELMELLQWVEEWVDVDAGCDGSLRFTCDFLRNHELPEEAAVTWLQAHAGCGCCDCDVVALITPEMVEEV